MLNSDSPFAEATRSIYFGNLPLTSSIRDICDLVRGERGLESVRLLPGKSCGFVDFISRVGAQRFIERTRKLRGKLQISGQDIKLGWAKEKIIQPTIAKAIENGATRNVYLNFPPLDPKDPLLSKFMDYLIDSEKDLNPTSSSSTTLTNYSDYFSPENLHVNEITDLDYPLVSFLYGIFDEFGPLDMIKVVPARRIAFIHMAQVADAMRAVAELPTRPEFRGKRLAFGRDRCGERLDVDEQQQQQKQQQQGSHTLNNIPSLESVQSLESSTSFSLIPSRTVYLGGCNSNEITIEDICDLIHTGQLQSVRINRDRHCAFVTFINPVGAEMFLGRALQFGLMIRNCVIKPAFAKESSTGSSSFNASSSHANSHSSINSAGSSSNSGLPAAIAAALRKGYTRNVYLGNIDFSILTETRLRTEMSRFGPLDRIQILKDRGVAFVHFANLMDGGRAFEQIKGDLCYRNCKVGFGKDRCEPTSASSSNSNNNINNNYVGNQQHKNMYNNMQNYYQNYPPPPLYFHPMMYDPSVTMYNPLDYPPIPYTPTSNYTINLADEHQDVVASGAQVGVEEEEVLQREEQHREYKPNVDK